MLFSNHWSDEGDALSDSEDHLLGSLIIFDVLVEIVEFLASHV